MNTDELETWFSERSGWLQDAARRLCDKGELTETDREELVALCIAEASGEAIQFTPLRGGSLCASDRAFYLRLESVADAVGINALAATKPLSFGNSPLSIVYGRNGAGKSGYVRVLKHACGAKRPGKLLGNIYDRGSRPQSATFSVSIDGVPSKLVWNGTPVAELRGVEIYDTDSGVFYVRDENETTVEPWILRYFSALTDVSGDVGERIRLRAAALVPRKPSIPAELSKSSGALWYERLGIGTTSEEVDRRCEWSSDHERTLAGLGTRLAEAAPGTKAAVLRRRCEVIRSKSQEFTRCFSGYEDERVHAILRLKSDSAAKRQAADSDAELVFKGAPLEGVGSDSWRILWESARRFSVEHAYPSYEFPNTGSGSRCLLCQQALGTDAVTRLHSFEEFVKGDLQVLAQEAEAKLREAIVALPSLPLPAEVLLALDAMGIPDAEFRDKVSDSVAALAMRQQSVLEATEFDQVSAMSSGEWISELLECAKDLDAQARVCDEDAKGENRPALEAEANELYARRWLGQQRDAVSGEVARLQAVEQLKAAEASANTRALSLKKTALTEELITNAYKQRFQDELSALGANSVRVEVRKTRTSVGRTYHQIVLRDCQRDASPSDILSEGEFRIVSLAAFLADTDGREASTPFIFDDPISSLDHLYEELLAQRLVELSKGRQVIVFTHRLSLVAFLEKYAEKSKVAPELVCLSNRVPGEVSNFSIDLKRTDSAANQLRNERLAALRRANSDDEFDALAKVMCRDIRVLLERIVERDLLNDVVRRFSPEVTTKGKLHALARITQADCDMVDGYMTKYSRYEHSQPEDAPVSFPKCDEFEADLANIAGLIKTVRDRNKDTLA